jgi:hypothetical protein
MILQIYNNNFIIKYIISINERIMMPKIGWI